MFINYRLIKRRVSGVEVLDLRRVVYADPAAITVIGVENSPYFVEGADRLDILRNLEAMVEAVERPYIYVPSLDE